MISAVNALEPAFKKSAQQQLLIEMLLVRMALLDRTLALEDLLKGLSGEGPTRSERDLPGNSDRAQPPQASVARPAQRPATRPGYPPQLEAPNMLPDKAVPKSSAAA